MQLANKSQIAKRMEVNIHVDCLSNVKTSRSFEAESIEQNFHIEN